MHKSMGYQKKYKENVGFYCKNGYKMVQKRKNMKNLFAKERLKMKGIFAK